MPTNPVKQSPIAVLTSAEATAGAVVAFLVAHGVIPADVAKTYGPYAVLLYVAAFGAVKWRHVTPWAKAKNLVAALEDGRLPDADVTRLLAGVEEIVHGALGTDPLAQHLTGGDHPDAERLADLPIPEGLAAGAPDLPTAPPTA